MATLTKPYTFVTGATILASENNSNFDTLYNDYNGGIQNVNIAADAAIAESKLQVTSVAFRVFLAANQTIATATATKILWDSESFDTASYFASNKFTPLRAGKYLLVANLTYDGLSANKNGVVNIYKNGALVKYGGRSDGYGAGVYSRNAQVFDIVSANGTTDYFEIYTEHDEGGNKDVVGATTESFFAGFRLHLTS